MANDITQVRLLKVPLENDYKHTLYFSNTTDQANYFLGKTAFYRQDFSYQRKEGYIRYPGHYDELKYCNYLMYKNANEYDNKWFYAFITRMEYKNDETTFIYFETDVIQTYLKDYKILPSFVEREHVVVDTVGAHTIPESLETGEYIINKNFIFKNDGNELKYGVVLGTTLSLSSFDNGDNKFPNGGGGVYNNIFSGLKYYYFENVYTNRHPNNTETNIIPTLYDLEMIIKGIANTGQSEGIVSLFIVQDFITTDSNNYNLYDLDVNEAKFYFCEIKTSYIAYGQFWELVKNTDLDGYVPRNNKLLTHPYSYLRIDNNGGNSAIYNYEYFTNDNEARKPVFRINNAIAPGGSTKLTPVNYKQSKNIAGAYQGNNNGEVLAGAKLPICSWVNDIYTNWLTQQSINESYMMWDHVLSQGGAQVGGGAIQGGGIGALAGGINWTAEGISKIMENMRQREIHQRIPPQIQGNVNTGDVNFVLEILTFQGYEMCIKKEYAMAIDDYFDMYGYQCNRVKIPNKEHRENWWYTKTIGANIDGNIPGDDIQKIKNCYDQGITFWKTPANIGDYTKSNGLVSG